MATPQRVPLLVVGGGIGGLAVANALAKRGREVHLIEKAPEFGEIGAGIQLAPNASWALDRIGALDDIRSYAVFPQRIVWMDAVSGEQLTALDLGEKFVARYGYPYFVMHRSDLLTVLLEHAQRESLVTLETDKDVVKIEHRERTALVTCADGSAYEADIVVGADGLWSTVRKFVHDDGDPICSEYVAYRGAIPMEDVSAHAGLDNVVAWTGPEMHLIQYPIRRGELYNQVAVFRSHRYKPGSHDWGTPEELDEKFDTGVDLVRSALGRFWRNRRWPMFDRLPIAQWQQGRVILMGDAAHPMLQYLAQGAAQALEDAAVLGDAIANHADVDAAFAAYQSARVERTSRVQTEARRWGDYWHLFPGDGMARRDAYLRARADDDYSESDWLYGYGERYATR